MLASLIGLLLARRLLAGCLPHCRLALAAAAGLAAADCWLEAGCCLLAASWLAFKSKGCWSERVKGSSPGAYSNRSRLLQDAMQQDFKISDCKI